LPFKSHLSLCVALKRAHWHKHSNRVITMAY